MRISLLLFCLAVTVQAQDAVPDKVGKKVASNFQKLISRKGLSEDKKVILIKKMAQAPHRETAKVLAPYLRSDSLAVRITTARVLVQYQQINGVGDAFVAAFKHPANKGDGWEPVRITLLRAIGDIKYVKGVDLINANISNEREWVARAAVVSSVRLRQKSSIEFLIKELRNLEGDKGAKKVTSKPDITDPLAEELKGTGGLSLDLHEVIKYHDRKDSAPKTRRHALEKTIHEALYLLTGLTFKNAEKWESWWRNAHKQFRIVPPKKPRRKK